jgi:hypothetical protein
VRRAERFGPAGPPGAAPPRNQDRNSSLEHDPEKWTPVFGKDHAPAITSPAWPPLLLSRRRWRCPPARV